MFMATYNLVGMARHQGTCLWFVLLLCHVGRALGPTSCTANLSGGGGDRVPSPPSTSLHLLPVAPAWIPDSARSQVAQQDQWQQVIPVCHNSGYRMKSHVQNDSGAGDSLSFFLEVSHSHLPLVLQHNLSAGARMLALESQSCFSNSHREPTHLSSEKCNRKQSLNSLSTRL